MKKIVAYFWLLLAFGCVNPSVLLPAPIPYIPGQSVDQAAPSFDIVAGSGNKPVILEVEVAAGDLSYSSLVQRTVERVRLVGITDPNRVYELTSQGRFLPYSLATDFYMWRWRLPTGAAQGD